MKMESTQPMAASRYSATRKMRLAWRGSSLASAWEIMRDTATGKPAEDTVSSRL